jgi:energy-converting hydrogenase Eha subunit C
VADYLKDAQGDHIQGFYWNLGRRNSQDAKMWSLLHVMHIARHLYLDLAIFETDFTIVATVVLNRSTTISYLKPLS